MTDAIPALADPPTVATNELDEPRWAVISFDKVEAGNLRHSEGVRLLSELDEKGIAGLCVATDQTAARLAA